MALALVTADSLHVEEHWKKNREYEFRSKRIGIFSTNKTYIPARAFVEESDADVSTL